MQITLLKRNENNFIQLFKPSFKDWAGNKLGFIGKTTSGGFRVLIFPLGLWIEVTA